MATAYVALVPINFGYVRAYNEGDVVPDANVALYGYDTQGLVQQVTIANPGQTPSDPFDLRTAALIGGSTSATALAAKAASVAAVLEAINTGAIVAGYDGGVLV